MGRFANLNTTFSGPCHNRGRDIITYCVIYRSRHKNTYTCRCFPKAREDLGFNVPQCLYVVWPSPVGVER